MACLLATTASVSAGYFKERDYQKSWCSRVGGEMEYRLKDETRVDCLTATHAIEFDFAKKWAESIGQALYYAQMTGKHPGVVLIMERRGDDRFLKRLEAVAADEGITVWTVTPRDIKHGGTE